MPIPRLPTRIYQPDDIDHVWDYIKRLRDTLEGTESGTPSVLETLIELGLFPSSRSLILDGGFERSRDAWFLSAGQRILSDPALARTGYHCLACTTTASGLWAWANVAVGVNCAPGDVMVILGYGRRSSGGSSTGQLGVDFRDRDGNNVAILSTVPTTLTTSYQLMGGSMVVPATAVSAAFVVRGETISSGEAYFDDISAFFLPYQDQHQETIGPTNFVAETVIGQVPILSARALGFYDVIVEADMDIITANANNAVTIRIRRDTTSGAILNGSERALIPGVVGRFPVHTRGFDATPNSVSQLYVVTAQLAGGTGTPSATVVTASAHQRNLLTS